MDELRAAAGAHVFDQSPGQCIERHDIVAVDGMGRHAEALRPRRRPRPAGHIAGAGAGRIAVVLAHEQHRQIVDPGPVEPFQEGAAIDRAIAKETRHHHVFAKQPLALRRTGGNRQAGRHDAVGAQHADRKIGDVHRAALAVAGAAGAAEQLSHHRQWIGALGQSVAVAAMGAGNQVGPAQIAADAGRDRFLTDRQMRSAGDQPFLGGPVGGFLEGADARHRGVETKDSLRRRRDGCCWHGTGLLG